MRPYLIDAPVDGGRAKGFKPRKKLDFCGRRVILKQGLTLSKLDAEGFLPWPPACSDGRLLF